uniref:Isoprenylcysteine alpha-carbonyl methylesterase ICME-like n=2 Tax=Rhizophora mucronata TaxID=61149 RepID=A0A2P2MVF7_RHIMU
MDALFFMLHLLPFGILIRYNLLGLVDHFDSRGLYRSLFLSIMEGEESLHRFSPEVRIQEPGGIRDAVSLRPPTMLFHGTSDNAIPAASSKEFLEILPGLGAHAELILFEGKNHTDLFLQVSTHFDVPMVIIGSLAPREKNIHRAFLLICCPIALLHMLEE